MPTPRMLGLVTPLALPLVVVAALAGPASLGCGEKPGSKPEPAGSTSAANGAKTAATPAPSAAGSATGATSASAKAGLAGTWSGTFTTVRRKIELPSDVSDKTWKQDDGKSAIGDATIEVTIAANGDAMGTSKGSIGDVTVRGRAEDGSLRATLAPVDPNDSKSLTGYVDLDLKDGKLEGKLHASGPDAVVVREATVTLERKP